MQTEIEKIAYELGLELAEFRQFSAVGVDECGIVVYTATKRISNDFRQKIPKNYQGLRVRIEYLGKIEATLA